MTICISVSEVVKHGCPFCNFRSHTSTLSGRGATVCNCGECKEGFIVLSDGLTQSPFGQPDGNGNTIYSELQEHPKKDGLARGKSDICPDEGEWFSSRGVGLDVTNGCLFCDKEHDNLVNNISGFIRTKEAGDRLLSWFNKGESKNPLERVGVRFAYREYEPDYLQFKIGACNEHLKQLQVLDYYTGLSGTITKNYLEKSKNLELPTFKEALKKYITKQKNQSEGYLKKEPGNIYQQGCLYAFKLVERYIEKTKDSKLKNHILDFLIPLKEIADEEYLKGKDEYEDYNMCNHLDRGRKNTFGEIEWFINRFTDFVKRINLKK